MWNDGTEKKGCGIETAKIEQDDRMNVNGDSSTNSDRHRQTTQLGNVLLFLVLFEAPFGRLEGVRVFVYCMHVHLQAYSIVKLKVFTPGSFWLSIAVRMLKIVVLQFTIKMFIVQLRNTE